MDRIDLSEGEQEGGRSFSALLSHLKQRQLFRFAAGYTVAAWLAIQVAATIGPIFEAPTWFLRSVILLAIAGFVLAVGYFFLFHEPARDRGWLGSRKYVRLLTAGALLAVLATGATWIVRGGLLFGSERISLAVLPFSDLSPGRDRAYFAEGIAEEILSTLAAEKDLKVLGRTSASQIQRNPDPSAIRASLGVTHLLEGSTRTAGKDLRVNVRLIDTSDGTQMWEEEYHGTVSDVFSVQDKIATAVVRRLRGTFFENARRSATPTSIGAYEAYLAARALIRENKKEPMTRAWHMARRIVEAHPDYAPGHALYAELTHLLTDGPYSYGNIPPHKSRPIILKHSREAIRLAPNRAEGYAALGLAQQAQVGVQSFLKAIELDPSRADVRTRLGIALNLLGRHDEAFEQYRLAAETDPLSAGIINRYTQMLASSGRTGDAVGAIEAFVRRGGSAAQGWRFRGNNARLLGDESGHVVARMRALQLDPGLPYQHEWAGRALHFLGLDELGGGYRAHISPYFQLFVDDDRGALKDRLLNDGAKAWDSNGVESALFSLARARDWLSILRFYDARPAEFHNLCAVQPEFTVHVALALQNAQRGREAGRLLECMQNRVTAELGAKYRGPDEAPGWVELKQASLLALRKDGRAIDWLDKAMNRGWMGQYHSGKLSDWPQFDGIRDDPRYARLQKRMDAAVARERAETLRLLNRPTAP
jgi:TolB-like protein/tetratricopeptide (TPR) repeat protein